MKSKLTISKGSIRTVLIFCMIYFSNVTLIFGSNSNYRLVTLSRYACLALALVFVFKTLSRRFRLGRTTYPLIVFGVIQIVNVLLGKSTYQIMFVQMAYILCGYFLCQVFSFCELKDSFCKVMYILAVSSLVIGLIDMAFPALSVHFPTVINTSGTKYHCFVLANRYADIGTFQRNLGIFWESGTFCIFLNIAIFLLLFDNTVKVKEIIVLIITEISTLSTGGVACLLLIILVYILTNSSSKGTKQKFIIIGTIIVFAGFLIFGDVIIDQIFKRNLSQGITTSGSTIARYASIIGNLRITFEYPFLGCGYSNIQNMFINKSIEIFSYDLRTGANTNTILYNFAVNGMIYGFTLYIGIVKSFSNYLGSIMRNKIYLIMCFLVFVLFMNENLQNSSLVYIIAFLGYSNL